MTTFPDFTKLDLGTPHAKAPSGSRKRTLETPEGIDLATAYSAADTAGLDYLDEEIPPAAQRRVVKRYSALVGARGTAKGLQGLLEALTGAPVEVRDSGGIYYDRPAPAETPSHVDISVGSSATPDPVQLDDTDLTRIVRRELPASVTFTMQRAGRTVHPSPESDDD